MAGPAGRDVREGDGRAPPPCGTRVAENLGVALATEIDEVAMEIVASVGMKPVERERFLQT